MSFRRTVVFYLARTITMTMDIWSKMGNFVSDYFYPPEVPYIESVLAISEEAYHSDISDNEVPVSDEEGEVHDWIDLTREYRNTGTIDLTRLRKKMESFRIEYRYWFRRSKFRYVVNPDEKQDISFPSIDSLTEARVAFSSKPLTAHVIFPEGHRELVNRRLLKYAGPRCDFYGGNQIRCQWLFPWWTPESFVGVKLQILDNHIQMHTFEMEENGFLTLQT